MLALTLMILASVATPKCDAAKVRVCTSGCPSHTIRVLRTSTNPDCRMRWVSYTPRSGEWQQVDAHPDYWVRFVESNPHMRIEVTY